MRYSLIHNLLTQLPPQLPHQKPIRKHIHLDPEHIGRAYQRILLTPNPTLILHLLLNCRLGTHRPLRISDRELRIVQPVHEDVKDSWLNIIEFDAVLTLGPVAREGVAEVGGVVREQGFGHVEGDVIWSDSEKDVLGVSVAAQCTAVGSVFTAVG